MIGLHELNRILSICNILLEENIVPHYVNMQYSSRGEHRPVYEYVHLGFSLSLSLSLSAEFIQLWQFEFRTIMKTDWENSDTGHLRFLVVDRTHGAFRGSTLGVTWAVFLMGEQKNLKSSLGWNWEDPNHPTLHPWSDKSF